MDLWSSSMEGTASWRSGLAFIVDMEHRPGTTLGIRSLKKRIISRDEKGDIKSNAHSRRTAEGEESEEEGDEGRIEQEQGDMYQISDEILLHYAKTGDLKGLEEHIVMHRRSSEQRLQFNANCTDSMSPPLFYAAEGGHEEFAAFLLANGAEVDAKNHNDVTALFIAAQVGAASVVRLLMDKGADPNLRSTRDDVLPLYVACFEGHLDVVKELLLFHNAKECEEQGGSELPMSVNMVNAAGVGADGSTALMASCERGHKDIVEFLLSYGAEKDARGKSGETALMWAVQEGYFGIVELLLQRGSSVNIQKNDGATPLFLAVLSGDTRMVSLLLAYGARNEIPNGQGETPRMVARRTGLHDIAHLLLVPPPFSLVDQL